MQIFSTPGHRHTGSHVLAKVVVLTAMFAATGCGMQPYDPPNNREYPPGPGLFSGKDGDFVIYRQQETVADAPTEEAQAGEATANNAPTDEKKESEQPQ